jgi:hypothetical protein
MKNQHKFVKDAYIYDNFDYGLGGVSISIVLIDEVKHVQSIQFNSLLTNVIQHIGIHIFNIYNYIDHK